MASETIHTLLQVSCIVYMKALFCQCSCLESVTDCFSFLLSYQNTITCQIIFLSLIMCKHAIVIYCLLSQPCNFFTCSHASSLALFPIESLHKVTFEERTATRTGHFILKQSTREKHLTSGYCPSLKKQCFAQFLDDFSRPFNVVRLLLQCLFFFLPFLQVLFGSLHECYVSRELF